MSRPLSDQMFAVLDAIVCGDDTAFESFPPQNMVNALVRRGLVSEETITAEPGDLEYIFKAMGFVRLVATEAGRKVVAEAEANRERAHA